MYERIQTSVVQYVLLSCLPLVSFQNSCWYFLSSFHLLRQSEILLSLPLMCVVFTWNWCFADMYAISRRHFCMNASLTDPEFTTSTEASSSQAKQIFLPVNLFAHRLMATQMVSNSSLEMWCSFPSMCLGNTQWKNSFPHIPPVAFRLVSEEIVSSGCFHSSSHNSDTPLYVGRYVLHYSTSLSVSLSSLCAPLCGKPLSLFSSLEMKIRPGLTQFDMKLSLPIKLSSSFLVTQSFCVHFCSSCMMLIILSGDTSIVIFKVSKIVPRNSILVEGDTAFSRASSAPAAFKIYPNASKLSQAMLAGSALPKSSKYGVLKYPCCWWMKAMLVVIIWQA